MTRYLVLFFLAGCEAPPCVDAFYPDADGDGYGDPFGAVIDCEAPEGYVADDADCDDGDALQRPGAIWHRDGDGDGFGDAAFVLEGCSQPLGYVPDDTDCDDMDGTRHPEGVWFADGDGDGFGGSSEVDSCGDVSSAAPASDDCDDADPEVRPDADELCDEIDNDCDGLIDDDDPTIDVYTQLPLYRDDDGDGWGTDELVGRGCYTSTLGALRSGDCADDDPDIFPGRTEDRDEVDRNCDGDATNHRAEASVSSWAGDARYVSFSYTVASADVDGDGWRDLAILELDWGDDQGAVRVVPGDAWSVPGFERGVTQTIPDDTPRWECSEIDGNLGYEALGIGSDWDGDGVAEVIVGGRHQNEYSGRVYVVPWDAPSGDIADVATVVFEHPEPEAQLGRTVASLDGMYFAGAPFENGDVDGSGALWILSPDGSHETIRGDSWDRLGMMVADVGDVDGDGRRELAVNAPYADDPENSAGTVYLSAVDDLVGVTHAEDIPMRYNGSATKDLFGWNLAALGDVDGDGRDDFAAASPYYDLTDDEGVAWVLLGQADWTEPPTAADALWRLEGLGVDDYFGRFITGPGDMDGDGGADLLIAAAYDDTIDSNSGAVYLIPSDLEPGTYTAEEAASMIMRGQRSYAVGRGLAPAGDLDGDGRMDAWVGSTAGNSYYGAVYALFGEDL